MKLQNTSPLWGEVKHWLQLTLVPKLGPITLNKLWQLYRSPIDILNLSRTELTRHLPAAITDGILQSAQNKKIIQQLQLTQQWHDSSSQHHIIPIGHPLYPPLLLELPDAPILLYIIGSPLLLQDPQIAVVGSRHPSINGKSTTQRITKELCHAGLTITSGLAYGIDGAAHQTAIDKSHPTIAVLGTGINNIYPQQHKQLAKNIESLGSLVSEFPLNTLPYPGNFPKRNRLIAGLSLGTLVVEATLSSGSLLTARLAIEQNKVVFAMPGIPDNPLHKGCHKLIRDGAILVEKAQHIIEELSEPLQLFVRKAHLSKPKESNETKLPSTWEAVIKIMNNQVMPIDELIQHIDKSYEELTSLLTEMELSGVIRTVAGGYQSII